MNTEDNLPDRLDRLGEYERFLLNALLEQATREAGRPLTSAVRRRITADFIEEHEQGRKTQAEARRKAVASRKVQRTLAQKKTDFQWQPSAPRRRTEGR